MEDDGVRHSPSCANNNVAHRKWRISLPAWLDHFNIRDLKILFRCWVATWVASLLIFIGPALDKIGVATFFGALLLYVVPPAGILFIYLLASLSLLFGMCLGWAWGLLSMKAALAARPATETQALLQKLQQQATIQAKQTGESPSFIAQKLVHDGFMLDARVTVIFYVLISLFVYAMSRIRVANPKCVLAQLFGIVVADLFLLFGPTVPSFTPLLAEVLVKPAAIGIGIGAVCCLIFFPQSTSYVVLSKMEQLIQLGEAPLRSTRERLSRKSVNLQRLEAERGQIIGALKTISPAMTFLPLDLSRGHWGPDDIKSLNRPLRQFMMAGLSLIDFHISRTALDQRLENMNLHSENENISSEKSFHRVGRRQLRETASVMSALKNPEEGAIQSGTLDGMRISTFDVLNLCSGSITLVAESIRTVNSNRWFAPSVKTTIAELIDKIQQVRESLSSARSLCITTTTRQLIENHSDLFEDDGRLKSPEEFGPYSLRGVIVGMVVEERIIVFTEAMEHLLDHSLSLLQKRAENRFWLPFRLQYWLAWIVNGRQRAPVSGFSPGTNSDDPDMLGEQIKEAHRQLRISRGYTNPLHRNTVLKAVISSYRWLTNPGGMYALRMVAVTIACAIPSSLPHSSGFYFREKGIWGLITAQTTLLVYMADFTFSLVSRALGTVVGGVLGMIAWYIGSGHGTGNAYGMATITAVMTAILMWWRLFLPQHFTMAAIMSGVTFVLVVGFSYDDAHIQQYGLPGHGYEAFWKRLVTVLLGFVAAFVVQLFPRPPSTTRHACKTLSNTVRTLSDHYSLLLSHWGRIDHQNPIGAVVEKISLDVAETLMSLDGPISMLRFEISLGPFNQDVLAHMKKLCQDMNLALSRLLILSTSLPPEFQERLIHTAGIRDEHAIGDIMAVLSIVEQALQSGLPLPERLPTPLIRRCYESWHIRRMTVALSKTLIEDENYRRYCVAVSSYLKFLSIIDDMVLALKETLGESHIIDSWEENVVSSV
ncbi:hypothetical protein BDV59DRAFT_191799 [Aspergillus ambiguus]|uniref:uncharacterized protein n=1 Tax=Aspergillus ambiguus TaxID=176160 RepID=UPI003CCD8789